jgi:hypothetical protein
MVDQLLPSGMTFFIRHPRRLLAGIHLKRREMSFLPQAVGMTDA